MAQLVMTALICLYIVIGPQREKAWLRGFVNNKGAVQTALICWYIVIGPQSQKTCLKGFVNNKGADQTAHLRSLISAFVICLSERIISILATSDISIF